MDASTHVSIAQVVAMGDTIKLRLMYNTAGEHAMFFGVTVEGKSKELLIGFQPGEWVEFKRSVNAVDEAIRQLRKKEQIFDFSGGPPSHKDELAVEVPAKPGEPDAVNIDYFMCSKKNQAGGVVTKECRSMAEIEEFKRATA